MGTPGQSWSGHAGGCSAGPHSSPLPLPFPAGILWLSLAWGQHRGCDTTGGGEKRLSSTCQGKGSTSEHSSQQNSPSCCRAERSPTLRAAPTRTASPGTRTRLAMVSQEGCVGRAACPATLLPAGQILLGFAVPGTRFHRAEDGALRAPAWWHREELRGPGLVPGGWRQHQVLVLGLDPGGE